MDCESVDIYPVGWGELVGHKLEGPRQAAPLKKEKKKTVGKRGKKRAHGNGAVSPGSGLSQVSTYLTIELLNNKSHGLSPSVGFVSPSGGFASLLFDQGAP